MGARVRRLSLAVPVPVGAGDADRLYRWWYGGRARPRRWRPRPSSRRSSSSSTGSSWPGPDLTASTFATGLFRAPPAGGGPTSPLQAYGYQGAPPLPSYSSPADYTFFWYDATAKGPDEEGSSAPG